jgi:hypothetical protein
VDSIEEEHEVTTKNIDTRSIKKGEAFVYISLLPAIFINIDK